MGAPGVIGNQDAELALRVKGAAASIADVPTATATAAQTTSVAALLLTLIADHNTLVGKFNALVTDNQSMRTTLNDLLAKSRTGGLLLP